ncbi:hypothetical protein M5K25_025224 [Dendrobium thyrsiflorum]|uniref:Uncharacterized protein n=1 Tax=Dendrobium thyrsiflorum TaxID=117978 RepID=A0ABD0U3M1_DENTH
MEGRNRRPEMEILLAGVVLAVGRRLAGRRWLQKGRGRDLSSESGRAKTETSRVFSKMREPEPFQAGLAAACL